jgi:hypothetical protein
MAETDGMKLTGISIDLAEDGYEIRVCKQKESLSSRKGWIPQQYKEEKYVATTKKELLEKLAKVVPDVEKKKK